MANLKQIKERGMYQTWIKQMTTEQSVRGANKNKNKSEKQQAQW